MKNSNIINYSLCIFFVVSTLFPFLKVYVDNYYLQLDFTLVIFANFIFSTIIFGSAKSKLELNGFSLLGICLLILVTLNLLVHRRFNEQLPYFIYVVSFISSSIAVKYAFKYVLKELTSNLIIVALSIVMFIHILYAFYDNTSLIGFNNGCFNNLNLFSNYLSVFFPLFFSKAIVNLHNRRLGIFDLWFWFISFMIIFMAIINNTRSSWLSISLTITISFFLLHTQNAKRKVSRINILSKFRLQNFVTTAIFVAFLVFAYLIKKDSADGRFAIWDLSFKIFTDHPFIGIGFNSFESQYNLYQAAYFDNNYDSNKMRLADDVYVPYNEFLQSICELGFSVVLLWCCLCIYVFKQCSEIFRVIKHTNEVHWSYVSYLGLLSFCCVTFNCSYPLSVVEITNAIFLTHYIIDIELDRKLSSKI